MPFRKPFHGRDYKNNSDIIINLIRAGRGINRPIRPAVCFCAHFPRVLPAEDIYGIIISSNYSKINVRRWWVRN